MTISSLARFIFTFSLSSLAIYIPVSPLLVRGYQYLLVTRLLACLDVSTMVEKKLAAAAMEKGRKPGLITKTLDRCRSARMRSKPQPAPAVGCFTVCVGAGRQRFVVRTECVNHPLFRALLEEAEEAFGYAAAGPLALPCDADAFVRVLEQIEEEAAAGEAVARCGLTRGHSAYRLLAAGRPLVVGRS